MTGFSESSERSMTRAEDLTICKHGKRQSPINIATDALIFDLSLQPVKLHGANQQAS
ncbi:unnamed protein product [Hymenolepis diminuta]|uniref:Uncharacterized protein n=1 Tax=Hymenolepis diminuta TaxID=6216 RepID=A0A564YUU1_HYMDI|nr:unnamed protein product [Hymenolepis diminuta]